jgi:copper(I)-binding protein
MKRLVWIVAPALAAGVCVGACDRPAATSEVKVEQPWVRLPAAPGQPGAAYFTLRSSSGGTSTLTVVGSPRVERIELHETRMEGNVARMAPVANIGFPQDGVLTFAPGGKHAMLFGIDPSVKPGDRIPLTFTFEPQQQVTAEAEVRGPGGAAHAGH